MRTLEEILALVHSGLGREPCDLVLHNVRLVNVFSRQVYTTQIYIRQKRIVSICPDANLAAREEIDCGGLYALPGLIDSHMHFESTMLSPEALADVIVPKGTTTICADLMEIANVAGERGIACMLESVRQLPYRMLIQVSSRVPTAPGLETTGATLGVDEVGRLLQMEQSISLGEMDPSKILMTKPEYLEKIQRTLAMRKVANGHAIGRTGQELNTYAASGISDDHECVTRREMLERLQLGMKVLIREGSTERNLEELITGALSLGLSCENLCFCTDDKHIDEIRREGHINYNVNKAIALGLSPMDAVSMATLNAARHFRLEDEIGSLTPGRLADILLCGSLEDIQPERVFFEGRLVYDAASPAPVAAVREYPAWIKHTVTLRKPVTAERFAVPAGGAQAEVNLIELVELQIINRWKTAVLPVRDGVVQCDPQADIAKIAVVERYGKNGNVGVGFIRGFTLRRGAVAYSMSHDHHNIVTIGTNDADMACCVNAVAQLQGGLAVAVNGRVTASMALPIGGLMSEHSAAEVQRQLEAMNAAAREAGCTLPSPFMTLSFVSLPTVPELGLTDRGLVDVGRHRLIPLVKKSEKREDGDGAAVPDRS